MSINHKMYFQLNDYVKNFYINNKGPIIKSKEDLINKIKTYKNEDDFDYTLEKVLTRLIEYIREEQNKKRDIVFKENVISLLESLKYYNFNEKIFSRISKSFKRTVAGKKRYSKKTNKRTRNRKYRRLNRTHKY